MPEKSLLLKELELDQEFQEAIKLLEDKKQLLNHIMNEMGDGLTIQDKQMRIIYQNKYMIDTFGSHIGEYCYKIYEKRDNICEGCPIVEAFKTKKIKRAIRVGVTKKGENFRFENVASILKNKQGEIIAGMELVRPVEDRERAFDELKAATKKLLLAKTVYENSSEGIMIVDNNNHIVSVNPAFEIITGYKQKEVIGKNPKLLSSKHQKKEFYSKMWQTLNKTGTWQGEIWNEHKNGKLYAQMMNIDTIYSKENEVLQYVCIFYDITEQKMLENELKNKEKMMIAQSRQAAMSEMIEMIAHQWRQPLATIGMSVNTILLDLELENVDMKELNLSMEAINNKLQYLSKTIDDFRSYFKTDKKKESISTVEILEKSLRLVKKHFENNNIEIYENIKTRTTFYTYSNDLIQVLINILTNAKEMLIKNKIKNPWVSIEIKEENKSIIFNISDNAGGIKKELLPRIFEPYFTTTQKSAGAGLGLYVSKTIVEKHLKGFLTVKNYKDGACFSIVIPK